MKLEISKLFLTVLFPPHDTVFAKITEIDPEELAPVPFIPRSVATGAAGRATAAGLIIEILQVAFLLVGSVAVLFLIYGGYRYITAHGNEEQAEAAKKILGQSVLGLAIVILSLVVIRVMTDILVKGAP